MPRVPPVTTATLAMVSSHRCRARVDRTRGKFSPGRASSRATGVYQMRALIARDAHRNPHATADAQRGEAFLGVALLHLVKQGRQDARARRADRMANRDRAAI